MHQNISKRNIPSSDVLECRHLFLASARNKEFDTSYSGAPLLQHSNSKIGYSSDKYDKVLFWNLPVLITCPGAFKWCLRHCYNTDSRESKFSITEWNKIFQYFLNDPIFLRFALITVLAENPGSVAVRIHSSGDFFQKGISITTMQLLCPIIPKLSKYEEQSTRVN